MKSILSRIFIVLCFISQQLMLKHIHLNSKWLLCSEDENARGVWVVFSLVSSQRNSSYKRIFFWRFFSVFRRKFHDLTTPLDSKFIVWRMLWECVEKFIVHKTIAGWEIEANDLRWSFPNDKVFRLFNTVRLFIILGCFAPNF